MGVDVRDCVPESMYLKLLGKYCAKLRVCEYEFEFVNSVCFW